MLQQFDADGNDSISGGELIAGMRRLQAGTQHGNAFETVNPGLLPAPAGVVDTVNLSDGTTPTVPSQPQPGPAWTGTVTPIVRAHIETIRQLTLPPNPDSPMSAANVTSALGNAAKVVGELQQAYDGYFGIAAGSSESAEAIGAGAPPDPARGAEFQNLLRYYGVSMQR